jgi:serine/threonine protein kinase
MPTKGDRDFGDLAVRQNFASAEDIERALEEQKRFEKEGALTTLDRLLVEMGIINPIQAEFLQEHLGRKVLFCPGCTAKYNVFGSPGGSKVKCRKCGETIDVPKRLSEMEPEERQARHDAKKKKYETSAFMGKVIGGYRILEEIGSGEMGVVFKAKQLSLDRVVALKVLPAELTRDKKRVEIFLKEAKAAGKLQHPNIVQVYDIGETGGLYYYSMEYIEGKSLVSILPAGAAMPLTEALRIVIQIAKALSHAHRYGILHRDLRPESILLNEEGVAKLADLGLSGTADQEGISGAGLAGGTPAYLSPEQLANARNASPAADLYSLGATFYRMLTGKDPFAGPNILAVMKAILEEEAVPVCEANAEIPKELSDIVARMMSRDVGARYRSADELLEDLNKFANQAAQDRAKGKDKKGSRSWPLSRKNK